jgi:putative cardiolipin synthase
MISDDPAKGLGLAAPENLFPQQLNGVIGEPATDVELVAAYYIPTTTGVNSFVSLARRGVKIKVLTNSFQASDGPYVYSGYAKHRKSLLEAGVTLYEMRPLSRHTGEHKSGGVLGSSGSSLHAKTFSVDRARFFVGSFNFDPRSRKLNTELGFVIDSPVLAQTIERAFNDSIPANSYEVRLSEAGRLYWIERRGTEQIRYDKSPNTSIWQRAAVWFLSLLPIEWLL